MCCFMENDVFFAGGSRGGFVSAIIGIFRRHGDGDDDDAGDDEDDGDGDDDGDYGDGDDIYQPFCFLLCTHDVHGDGKRNSTTGRHWLSFDANVLQQRLEASHLHYATTTTLRAALLRPCTRRTWGRTRLASGQLGIK